jgi:hypothetical protein
MMWWRENETSNGGRIAFGGGTRRVDKLAASLPARAWQVGRHVLQAA